jgi:hypothetical protein
LESSEDEWSTVMEISLISLSFNEYHNLMKLHMHITIWGLVLKSPHFSFPSFALDFESNFIWTFAFLAIYCVERLKHLFQFLVFSVPFEYYALLFTIMLCWNSAYESLIDVALLYWFSSFASYVHRHTWMRCVVVFLH